MFDVARLSRFAILKRLIFKKQFIRHIVVTNGPIIIENNSLKTIIFFYNII